MIIWLTGLSGSGKTTLAKKLKNNVPTGRKQFVLLDGDILRKGLCSDLRFSNEDRRENIRRVIEICKILTDAKKNVVCAFITPFDDQRILAKRFLKKCFIVYCKSSYETCRKRDVKGLYKKAEMGYLENFTGKTSDYEVPIKPDLILDTENQSVSKSFEILKDFYLKKLA